MGPLADDNHRSVYRGVPPRCGPLSPKFHHQPPLAHYQSQVQRLGEPAVVGYILERTQHRCSVRLPGILDPTQTGL